MAKSTCYPYCYEEGGFVGSMDSHPDCHHCTSSIPSYGPYLCMFRLSGCGKLNNGECGDLSTKCTCELKDIKWKDGFIRCNVHKSDRFEAEIREVERKMKKQGKQCKNVEHEKNDDPDDDPEVVRELAQMYLSKMIQYNS